MVKKNRGKGQQKTKVTLSLFDFNKDATVGTDVALAALPTAPKAAEEWEAEGGRPEYNSRGYRERRVDPYADAPRDLDDDEFDNRVWARRGPLDSGADSGFGAGPERDWNGARRGPLDDSSAAQPERDWGGARRGPVEADESAPPRDWGGARRGPVDADLPPVVERDWTARKGPVDADLPPPAEERDWTSRKGPVEAELPAAHAEPDWTSRKGPVEAEIPQEPKKQDWGAARRAPVEAEAPVIPVQERDWSTRKGPVEPEASSAQAPPRQVDFGNARRAPVDAVAPQQERPLTRAVSAPAEPAAPAPRADVQGSSNWRRSAQPSRGERPVSGGGGGDWGGLRRAVSAEDAKPQRRTDVAPPRRAGPHMQQRRPDNAQEASGKDSAPARDWGAARRAQPPAENQIEAPKVTIETDGEWTTVRTENRRRGSHRSRPPHQQKQAPLRQAAAQVAEKVHPAETGHTVA